MKQGETFRHRGTSGGRSYRMAMKREKNNFLPECRLRKRQSKGTEFEELAGKVTRVNMKVTTVKKRRR